MKKHLRWLVGLWMIPAMVLAQSVGTSSARDTTLDGLPSDFPQVFDQLSELAAQEELDLIDWARISYLAPRFFLVGPEGVPYTFARFKSAQTPEEGFLSGLFVATEGGSGYVLSIRKELETVKTKRVWLHQMVGTEKAFKESIEGGKQYRPALQYLPSPVGCRNLSMRCMESNDALVRRAGMYWGYWFANPNYWTIVQRWAVRESDPLTRSMANYLLKLHGKK